ncbi:MAG: DinB family protein [Bacteroidota bacterium]
MNTELVVKIALNSWNFEYNRFKKLLDKISNEQLLKEVAPGKNTGIYLFGHLTAVADAMRPMFDLGPALFPELGLPFVSTPDKSGLEFPTPDALRAMWAQVLEKSNADFQNMPAEDWFKRHSMVSEEDFAKEPHRNRFSVLLSRTIHQAYHAGQVALLVEKTA